MLPPLPRLMGIVNVTPDSFSDGGRWADPEAAIDHGRRLLADGADILDIGGESTRPGATRPLVEEELGRVVPVIAALAATGAVVSVDTMRAEVARAALDAGASIVNDVSGGLADPAMLEVVAASQATYVAMHWRAHSDHMQDFAAYDGPGGVVGAVREELSERVRAMLAAGIEPERIVLDPGLGFAKRGEHNWELLRGLDAAAGAGLPAARRSQPEAVPGRAPRGRGRHPAAGRRARVRRLRTHPAAGPAGRVGAAGARRPRQPRRAAGPGPHGGSPCGPGPALRP